MEKKFKRAEGNYYRLQTHFFYYMFIQENLFWARTRLQQINYSNVRKMMPRIPRIS